MNRLVLAGLNHNTAPLAVRERFAISPADCREVLDYLSREAGLQEAVLLATCNRVEVYGLRHPAASGPHLPLAEAIIRLQNLKSRDFSRYFYTRQGDEVSSHLFEVASGIDSMVLGENEILGQVKESYHAAQAAGRVGPILHQLFQRALRSAKEVRTRCGLNVGVMSVGSVSVDLAQKIFSDLAQHDCVIVGTGQMSRQIVELLRQRGVRRLCLISRTPSRVAALAAMWQARICAFGDLYRAVASADIVICSTRAPRTILHREPLSHVMRQRPHRPLFIIDIAVPRDVDDDVRSLENVFLYNLDDLQRVIQQNLHGRRQAVQLARPLLQEQVASFRRWFNTLEAVPTISELVRRQSSIWNQELEHFLKGRPDLTELQQEAIRKFSRQLMNRFLHDPTSQLRRVAESGDGLPYLAVARELFSLDDEKSEVRSQRSD